MSLSSRISPFAELAPSILDSDLANIADTLSILETSGIRYVHIDVMDGQFVPNISFGAPVVASIREHTDLILDVHLMIDAPERYIDAFVAAGADYVTVHPEATPHIHRVLQLIRAAGAKSGIALNPGTPVNVATNLLDLSDLVLIMSVNPGFGGQAFLESALRRIAELKEAIDETGSPALIEVDGGINRSNVVQLSEAGVDLVVIGSAIFRAEEGPAAAIARYQALLKGESDCA